MDNKARAFKTDFHLHSGLIKTFSRKAYSRLQKAGVTCVGDDDIFQDMCVTYVKAAKKYNPDSGVTFTAYLGRAIWNEFNRYAEKLINDAQLIQRMETSDDTGDWLFDMCENTIGSPEEIVEKFETVRSSFKRLSPTAKFFLSEFVNPSEQIQRHISGAKAKAEFARNSNIQSKVKTKFDLSMIGRVFDGAMVNIAGKTIQINPLSTRNAKKELFHVYEIAR